MNTINPEHTAIKKEKSDTLKHIKKLAENDDLKAILRLLEDNPQYLQNHKNIKALMAYAIKSKKTEILSYGFEHGWFKTIDWNANLITANYSGWTPLGWAVDNSWDFNHTNPIIQLLLLNGASLGNKLVGDGQDSIAQYAVTIFSQDILDKLFQMGRDTDSIKMKNALEETVPEKSRDNNKIKI